jgi:hypothetical protein
MPIITVSPAESAGFNESRHSSARNQEATFSTVSARNGRCWTASRTDEISLFADVAVGAVQTVRKLPEFGVKQREERAVRESERLGLIGLPDAT